jgi:hypothetical protein
VLLMSTRGRLEANVTYQHITIYLQHRPNKSFSTYREASSRVRCRFLLSYMDSIPGVFWQFRAYVPETRSSPRRLSVEPRH